MSVPSQGAPAQPRSLAGTLGKTPWARLLVSASSARVTGTLELACEGGESATVTMVRGNVTKVRTSAPVAYLGSVLYELGSIDDSELNESLRELARTKWLHGEILLTRAAIDPTQLAEGLNEQTTRKLVYLFNLPPQTTYAFEADVDKLAAWGGTDWPHVDPIASVWRGLRDGHGGEDVEGVFGRVKDAAFRLTGAASPKRFDFSDVETSAVECLRVSPLTLEQLSETAPIDPKRARLLLYFLLVTKQAEPIDNSGMRPAYRPSGSGYSAVNAPTQSRPTRPEMPAVGGPASYPTQRLARAEPTSANWRAVAPATPQSSAKMPVASPQPSDSAKWRIPTGASAAPSPRITMGGVAPTASTHWRAPGVPSSPSSAPGAMRSPSVAPGAMRSPPSAAPGAMRSPPSAAPGAMRTPSVTPGAWRSSPSAAPGSLRSTPPAPAPTSGQPSSANMPTARPAAARDSGQWRAASPSSPNNLAVGGVDSSSRKARINERARSILREDYFQRLSLPRDAPRDQVDAAYEALRTLWDPDLLPPALDDVRDDCAFVMTCLAEAHGTLRDGRAREEYVQRLGTSVLRTMVDQQADDLGASGCNDPAEGAEVCFKSGDFERAERLARRAVKASPEAAKSLALLAWVEAMKPSNQNPTDTRPRIAMLDRALRLDPSMEHAFYWRAQLHKRLENHSLAMRDFKRVAEMNPKNIEAARELRLYEMRIRRNSISMKAVK